MTGWASHQPFTRILTKVSVIRVTNTSLNMRGNSTLSFTEALSKDRKGYYRGWMLSGLLFDVYREFGYDTARQFMRQLAELAAKEGQVKSIAGVGQNILKAAQATGIDRLADYLRQKWRLQN